MAISGQYVAQRFTLHNTYLQEGTIPFVRPRGSLRQRYRRRGCCVCRSLRGVQLVVMVRRLEGVLDANDAAARMRKKMKEHMAVASEFNIG